MALAEIKAACADRGIVGADFETAMTTLADRLDTIPPLDDLTPAELHETLVAHFGSDAARIAIVTIDHFGLASP